MPDRYFDMLQALAAIYAAEGRAEATATAEALITSPQSGAPDHEATRPPLAEIAACLSGSDHPAARAILAALDLVPWGGNPVDGQMLDTARSIVTISTLMGPEGPIPSPFYRLGLLWQQPDTYYPLHNHDADETYVILAGSALWTAGDDVRDRSAGDVIHHPSLMPHAFRAGPSGFVALWRWSGDINTQSYAFLDDPLAASAAGAA